jgi:signal transduction histidine kinase/CheY-like chemotaxis protein
LEAAVPSSSDGPERNAFSKSAPVLLVGATLIAGVGLVMPTTHGIGFDYVAIHLGMAVVLGLAGWRVRVRPASSRTWALVVGIAVALYLAANAQMSASISEGQLVWLMALPLIFLVVASDDPTAVATCGLTSTLAVAAVATFLAVPPAEIAVQSVETALLTALATYAASRGRRIARDRTEAQRKEVAALSELASSERRRADAERMASIGRLAAGVGHEINNPLTYVVHNLDFAKEELKHRGFTDAEIQDALDNAREGAGRIKRIVRELRRLARPERDELVAVDTKAALEGAIRLVENQIRQRARLELDIEEGANVLADPGRLGQVFVNLLANAAQAIAVGDPDANLIRVRATFHGSREVMIEISDTGAGIAPKDIENVFEPSFTTKRETQGTGLGLTISRQIIEKFGGRIGVRSDHTGTTFSIVLQSAEEVTGEIETALDQALIEPRPENGRVLLVDDEPGVLLALKRTLQREHEVDGFAHAKEALEQIRRGRYYDVILCDLMMPEMSGTQFYQEVRKLDPALAERFVFMTGGVFTADVANFLKSISNARVDKPCDVATLRRIVAEQMATRAA